MVQVVTVGVPATPIRDAIAAYLSLLADAASLDAPAFAARVETFARSLQPLDRTSTRAVFDAVGLFLVDARDRTISGQKARIVRRLRSYREGIESLKV